jgi:hypothetical protein
MPTPIDREGLQRLVREEEAQHVPETESDLSCVDIVDSVGGMFW